MLLRIEFSFPFEVFEREELVCVREKIERGEVVLFITDFCN
jgi:hypothetical protein